MREHLQFTQHFFVPNIHTTSTPTAPVTPSSLFITNTLIKVTHDNHTIPIPNCVYHQSYLLPDLFTLPLLQDPYTTTAHNLTLANFSFIHSILAFRHSNLTITLYHPSHNCTNTPLPRPPYSYLITPPMYSISHKFFITFQIFLTQSK